MDERTQRRQELAGHDDDTLRVAPPGLLRGADAYAESARTKLTNRSLAQKPAKPATCLMAGYLALDYLTKNFPTLSLTVRNYDLTVEAMFEAAEQHGEDRKQVQRILPISRTIIRRFGSWTAFLRLLEINMSLLATHDWQAYWDETWTAAGPQPQLTDSLLMFDDDRALTG